MQCIAIFSHEIYLKRRIDAAFFLKWKSLKHHHKLSRKSSVKFKQIARMKHPNEMNLETDMIGCPANWVSFAWISISLTKLYALFPRYCTFQLARQGSWSSWTDWGPCDQKCTVVRERFCAAKDKSKCPGVDADGIQSQKKRCETDECNGRFKAGPGLLFSTTFDTFYIECLYYFIFKYQLSQKLPFWLRNLPLEKLKEECRTSFGFSDLGSLVYIRVSLDWLMVSKATRGKPRYNKRWRDWQAVHLYNEVS